MMATQTLYNETVAIAEEFLGPAAGRFIERQISTHLHKDKSDITRDDLVKLIDWIKVSVALLTEDPHIIESFTQKLLKLTR